MGLRSVAIADLDQPLQELVVGRWFDALSPDAEQAAEKAAEMRAHLAERAEVSPLVSSPMLLTALCVIYNQGKRLPRDKHELYDRILDNVLHNRYLDELEYADQLGFDGICVNEHHQNAYGFMPSPNIMAASLIRRTRDVAIIVLGNSIALYNPPVRVAEEMAMLERW